MVVADPAKVFDRNRPFVRINSPSANARPRLSGLGHDEAGNRRQEDFQPRFSLLDELVISQLIALTPSWARTLGDTEAEGEHEVFGKLQRSFQTWTDAPPGQWHTWYDWNFHIEPEPDFQWLRGFGNSDEFKTSDPVAARQPIPPLGGGSREEVRRRVAAQKTREEAKLEAVVKGRCMELEWDTGAFGPKPGGMFGRDWAWPMTDDFLWAAGRSIYDGGHEHEAEEAQSPAELERELTRTEVLDAAKKQPPPPKGSRLTRSELHPCKAIASARWEAHKFPGTPHFVPAIQFMFFASRLGGYKRFDKLQTPDGKNYEFIVDLPAPGNGFSAMTVPVGPTPDFPLNRIVLRRDLLVDFDFARFKDALGKPATPPDAREQFKPIVELLPEGAKPDERQAKITIPINEFAAAFPDLDSYGVVVSLGWPDPANEQAQHVKKCTVRLKSLQKASLDHDTFSEEWRLKVGINGRWFQFEFDGMGSNDSKDLNQDVVLHLHEEDSIRVSAHGAELDLVDDVYTKPRTITVSGLDIAQAVDPEAVDGDTKQNRIVWEKDVDISPRNQLPPPKFGRGSQPVQRAICQKLFDLMFSTFNDQNDPLGLIDPGRGDRAERAENPIRVSDVVKKVGENNAHAVSLKAMRTAEVGDSAELVAVDPDLADPEDLDYTLHYEILVETQDGL